MNLKESYRYANFLNNLLAKAYEYLNNKSFVTTTVQEHMRSKVNPDASNEILTVVKPYDVEFTPNDIIDFVVKVLNEKEKLAEAISVAKASTEINIDNAIALNKKKQEFVNILNKMANYKSAERIAQSVGRKFNVEGNQTTYYYDVVEKTTVDFNRNDVRGLIKKYLKETDEVSAKLDAIEINTQVLFIPKWDVNDEFEDLVLTPIQVAE